MTDAAIAVLLAAGWLGACLALVLLHRRRALARVRHRQAELLERRQARGLWKAGDFEGLRQLHARRNGRHHAKE